MVGNWLHLITGWNNIDSYKVPIFSNPNIFHSTCGANGCGDSLYGYAAYTLNDYASIYRAREEPDVHTLSFVSTQLSSCLKDKYRGIEIADFEHLNCSKSGIKSLAGIEQLSYLTSIDLSHNQVVDITPLTKLSITLDSINLQGNDTMACADLDKLETHFPGKISHPETCQ